MEEEIPLDKFLKENKTNIEAVEKKQYRFLIWDKRNKEFVKIEGQVAAFDLPIQVYKYHKKHLGASPNYCILDLEHKKIICSQEEKNVENKK